MDLPMIKIAAIFHTLDGECTHQGPLHRTTFVRTGGCHLRCWKSTGFCDAPHTLDLKASYEEMRIQDIMSRIMRHGSKRVTITGGEPLLQKSKILDLAAELKRWEYLVTLETSGSVFLNQWEQLHFDSIIADVKTPSTEMHKHNCLELHGNLRKQDYLKFVLQDKTDYDWSIDYIMKHGPFAAQLAFGPRWDYLQPRQIVEWLDNDKYYNIMLNMQMHKYIWPESATPPTDDLKLVDREALIKAER